MTGLNADGARCEALFAFELQRPDVTDRRTCDRGDQRHRVPARHPRLRGSDGTRVRRPPPGGRRAAAGRLSSRVPVWLLIGPGLIIIGMSLLLMRGLNAGPTWTHLIPGMIVAGVGVGLVNPPLASTAVGVVPPQQAGMASGINSTFRQVGIATGIALLGTLFSNDVKDEVLTRTAAVPGLAARGPEIAGAVQSGQIGNVIARLPAPARQVVGTITRAAFTTGLNRILLVAAIIAFVAGVVSLAAIRSRDFARAAPGGQEGPRK